MTLASWEKGLALRRGNPLAVRSVSDLACPDVRIVNRPPGAGARQLLDEALAEAGVEPSELPGYDLELPGHLAVASAVALGTADAGVTLRAAAETFGLDFLPLQPARFDLLVPRGAEAHPAVQALLDLLSSRALRDELHALPGYDAAETGNVVARFEAGA